MNEGAPKATRIEQASTKQEYTDRLRRWTVDIDKPEEEQTHVFYRDRNTGNITTGIINNIWQRPTTGPEKIRTMLAISPHDKSLAPEEGVRDVTFSRLQIIHNENLDVAPVERYKALLQEIADIEKKLTQTVNPQIEKNLQDQIAEYRTQLKELDRMEGDKELRDFRAKI